MRGVKGIVLLILALFIFNVKDVSAKNVDIVIEDINISSKSDTVEYTNPVVKDNKISSEITFNKLNDFVAFEVTLKNNENIKYLIEKISDDNRNSNITIDYDFNNKEIGVNGNKKIIIKFSYNKQVEQGDVLSFNDVKITLDLVKQNGEKAKVVFNPKTNDNILTYVSIFIISTTSIALLIKNKHLKKASLIVLVLLIGPKMISATTDEIYEINISFNNAHINGTAITYSINIDEELKKQEPQVSPDKIYKVVFDSNDASGSLEPISIKYAEEFNLPNNPYIKYGYKFIGWNTKKDGSGKNYNAGELVKGLTNEDEITLYANWENKTNGFTYEGTNVFGGKDNNIEGNISNNQSIDYLNTGIKPFSEENRTKNFILSFKITDFDVNKVKNTESLDTIFTIVPNASDISIDNPGVTLRFRNGKWIFQVGNETSQLFSKTINLNDLINKEFKLVRINNGSSIKLYYSIGNGDLILIKDLTNMSPNEAILSFGATYYDGVTGRYFDGAIDDISFKYFKNLGMSEFFKDEYDSDLPIVFQAKGPCEFNGNDGYVSGESCEMYANDKIINTQVSLFSEENYQKDFEISFDILSYNPNNQGTDTTQQTFMNIKLEDESLDYPGIVVRKNGSNIQFGAKDGNGQTDYKNVKYSDVLNVRVVRKDGIVYTSVNGAKFTKLSDLTNFNHPFDIPVYFGSSSEPDGTPMRLMKATLANMTIRMGKINKDIN